MRRIVVIVPELLGEPSVLRQKLPTLEHMAELGNLFKISPMPRVETPEAFMLGLDLTQGQLHPGPLTVSALGADPPERSTHFHLSLMSFGDGSASVPKVEVPAEELRPILDLAKKLNTKKLTIVEGEGLDHGLVWEGVGDLQTTPAREIEGKTIRRHLPEGDAEVALRRFIDDSINLLSEIELNQRRTDEDLPPLNLLWPWGEGARVPVPNLALRRGEPALVLSNSMRLQGLARLAGYRHGDRCDFGRGTNVRLAQIARRTLDEPVSIVLIDSFASFRSLGHIEEAEWLAKELDRELLTPIFEEALVNPTRLTLLAPGPETGLGVSFQSRDANANSLPFDERAVDEKQLASQPLWDAVSSALVQ